MRQFSLVYGPIFQSSIMNQFLMCCL